MMATPNVPALSPSTSISVLWSTPSPELELASAFQSPELDTLEPKEARSTGTPGGRRGRRPGPRMSRTGDERRADVLDQLGSLELDRTLVLQIAHDIERWGPTSSNLPLLVKVVTASDQQLVRLNADYYDGLESELDWAGVRIERGSRWGSSSGSTGWESPPTPLSEALLSAGRNRTSTAPPPTTSTAPLPSSPIDRVRADLSLTIPRRWSSALDPEPRHPTSSPSSRTTFPKRDAPPLGRRGSVQLGRATSEADGARSPVSDPGGYESLTWGSVQRPSTTSPSSQRPSNSSTASSPIEFQPSPYPASELHQQPAFFYPLPPAGHPSLANACAVSPPHSPEAAYPWSAASAGYYPYLFPPSTYSPTSGPRPYTSSASGSMDDGGSRSAGKPSWGSRGGKRGSHRNRGAVEIEEGGARALMGREGGRAARAIWGQSSAGPSVGASSVTGIQSSAEVDGVMGSKGTATGSVSTSSLSYPGLPSVASPIVSKSPRTDDPSTAAASYRNVTLRTTSASSAKRDHARGPSTKPRAETAELRDDLANLALGGRTVAVTADKPKQLSWAGVVKGR